MGCLLDEREGLGDAANAGLEVSAVEPEVTVVGRRGRDAGREVNCGLRRCGSRKCDHLGIRRGGSESGKCPNCQVVGEKYIPWPIRTACADVVGVVGASEEVTDIVNCPIVANRATEVDIISCF